MNQVTAASYGFATSVYDVAYAASEQLKSIDGPSAPRLNIAGTALDRFQRLFGRRSDGALVKEAAVRKAVLTETEPCESGQVVGVFNDANGNQDLDAGESATITFQNCVLSGVRFSGAIGMLVNAYSSTATTENGNVTFTFNAFGATAVSTGESSSVSGDMTIAGVITYPSSTSVTPSSVDATLSGRQVVGIESGATYTLADYSGRLILAPLANTYSYRIGGIASGGGLPGAVTISTPTAISGTVGANPSAGVLLVTGTGNSSLRMVVTPPTGVTIALDANGDGTPESNTSLTWAQLDAL
ncbi:MAG TPA: hypothetical protein VEA81_09840 [Burkholderiaceae bacterium]|nr:hypothetical protein [Burkholderiaceae bacterium]